MESCVYGNFNTEGIEIIERAGKYFVRYDAGSHQIALREDEISGVEFALIKEGGKSQIDALIQIQKRLTSSGANANQQNWFPEQT